MALQMQARPFVCDVYSLTFTVRQALTNHRRRHGDPERRPVEPPGPPARPSFELSGPPLDENAHEGGGYDDNSDYRSDNDRRLNSGSSAGDSTGSRSDDDDSNDEDSSHDDDDDGGGDDDDDDDDDGGGGGGCGDVPAANVGAGRALQLNASHLDFLRVVHDDGLTEKQANHVLAFFRGLPADSLGTFPRRVRTLHLAAERSVAQRRAAAPAPVPAPAPDRFHIAPAHFFERDYNIYGNHQHATMCDVWATIVLEFLMRPKTAEHLVFGPTPSPAPGQEPVLGELWTARWWQRAHDSLAPGMDVVAIILHFDDTPVAVAGSGGVPMLPLHATLGNLPLAQRRLHHNLLVVAFVPKSDAPEGVKAMVAYRRARRRHLHQFLADLLAPLRAVQDRRGVAVTVAERRRLLFPLVCLIIADNEEKAMLLLAYKKKNAARPCHHCLVTAVDLGDTVATANAPWPSRTIAAMKALVQEPEAEAPRDAGVCARARAQDMSLHPIPNGFWTVRWLPAGLYQACPPDLLHDADLGVFQGSHKPCSTGSREPARPAR
jgi:hypothetical protein